MMRWGVAAGCAAVVAGAALVSAGVRTGPAKAEVDGGPAKAVVVVGQRTGYFNMAKVMRDYTRAKTSVAQLNERKARMSGNLRGMQAMYLELQIVVQTTTDAGERERIMQEMLALTRRIEDDDRAINKAINGRTTTIIVGLYDEIHAVVAAVARDNGLTAVLAYPDAVTQEQMDDPQIKEMKLKPPALQPFYLDPAAEYSDEIIRRLNAKFAAEHAD